MTASSSGNSPSQQPSAPRRISASRLIRRLSRRRFVENNRHRGVPRGQVDRNNIHNGRGQHTGRQDDNLNEEVYLELELALEGEADAAAGGVIFSRPRLEQSRRPSFVDDDSDVSRVTIVSSGNVTAEGSTEDSIEQVLREESGNEEPSRGNRLRGVLQICYGLRDSFRLNRARVAVAPLVESSFDPPSNCIRRDSEGFDQDRRSYAEESFDDSFACFVLSGGIRDSLTLVNTDNIRRLVRLEENLS